MADNDKNAKRYFTMLFSRNNDVGASEYFKSLNQQIVMSPNDKTRKTLAKAINDVSEKSLIDITDEANDA